MTFEWDENKDRINYWKHGIRFETATRVFADPMRIEMFDVEHSGYEDRFITIGLVGGCLQVVTVVYTERDDSIRMISARLANSKEKELYYGRT